MNINRRVKYENRGRASIKTDKKISVHFGVDVLDLFCAYAISQNRNIRKSHLINLRNLIGLLDLEVYKTEPESMKRLRFIQNALVGRLDQRIENPILLMQYINGGIVDNNELNHLESLPLLTTDELDWINKTVSETLKYKFLYSEIDKWIELGMKFKNADYSNVGTIVSEIEEFIDGLKTNFRHCQVDKMEEMDFTLRPGQFEEVMQDTYDQLMSPSRRLRTGMQGLNMMTNGGFEAGRVYLFLGRSGVGKSMLLLNLLYQMKKANRNYQPKDPSKIPVIVMLTQENTVRETIQRLWDVVGFTDNMLDYSIDDIINKLKTEGELYLNDDSPIDIIIKYKSNRSIDTGYLYTMCEDLEDEGYEVISVFQDHVKRIRSVNPYVQGDIRLELGEVINEMKVFAAIKDIPVITIAHLNRDADKTIEGASGSTKADLTKLLGRQNVGESTLMLDNVDGGYIINKEYDKDGNVYLGIKRIKTREKTLSREYIAYPFVSGNEAKLVEDLDSPVPLFRESVHELNQIGKTNIAPTSYTSLANMENDTQGNLFDNMRALREKNEKGHYGNPNQISVPYEDDNTNNSQPEEYVEDVRISLNELYKNGLLKDNIVPFAQYVVNDDMTYHMTKDGKYSIVSFVDDKAVG